MKLFISLFFCFSPMAAPSPWAKLQDKDGISTFKRDLPGTSLISFKGIGTVKASLKKVFNY
ncbi:MAG: hypothetical protein ACO20H_04095 [Bacteriovoracaceae bacterium]